MYYPISKMISLSNSKRINLVLIIVQSLLCYVTWPGVVNNILSIQEGIIRRTLFPGFGKDWKSSTIIGID